ncbi:hypothetical protein [Deinococcus puniceus]|uniref:Lipoprotein n=1 Tax=Deinococcus puniceus TaxID=1182568 RepID=A0A172T734_9DEIO|nr:hypothetical protein [Deinococcus puniceus]ANE42772.1 hypothetical protein SU48_02235 [Deinococcus puniceus]
MKKITLGLLALTPLALASCNLFNTPEPKNLDGTVVEGKITTDGAGKMTLTTSGWAGGAGQVILKSFVTAGGAPEEITRTPLTADGKFNFAELPMLADKNLSSITVGDNANCTSTLVVSDKTARGGSALFTVDAEKDGAIFIIADDNLNKQISAIYIDKASTLKGQVKCTSSGVTRTSDYDINLKAGWNALLTVVAGDNVTFTNANSYRGQKWTLLTNNVASASLKTQAIFSLR